MNMRLAAARVAVITLAVIGGLAVLGGVSMLFMHSTMMGGTPFHGLLSSMRGMCQGMMGG